MMNLQFLRYFTVLFSVQIIFAKWMETVMYGVMYWQHLVRQNFFFNYIIFN